MTSEKKILQEIFGFHSFRQNQEEIIRQILDSRDVFAVMPTGGGKSLCYQLPARILKGTAIVISPLISLMKDQVDAAKETGLRAEFLNSTLNPDEKSTIYNDLTDGRIELLYIAPERSANKNFIETLKTINISFFAIDEAHCISEWGHDFRPDYLSLSGIAENFPAIPVAAFTATATKIVQDDIIKKLRLRSPYTVRASFNRPNLVYNVQRKENINKQILNYIDAHKGISGIVYRTTRDSVEKLHQFLSDNGISCLPYHAGIEAGTRKRNQEYFNQDKVDVIIATIAFGMGIDKSNIRYVIHGDLPKNIEGYYQETGRAGRDGELADCILFYGPGDIIKMNYFINQMESEKEREIASQKLLRMSKYATYNVCRRYQLLEYFSETYPESNCNACDICLGTVEVIDITTEAQIFLSAVVRTGQNFGIRHIIEIITGAETKKIKELNHDKIKTYGVGSHKDRRFWHYVADELLAQNVLFREGEYPVLKLTEKGSEILTGKLNIKGIKQAENKTKANSLKKSESLFQEYNKELFEDLRILRKELAMEQDVPPYIIFSDKTLHEMCAVNPKTMEDMREISGIGEVKLEKYGRLFLDRIRLFAGE